MTRGSCALALLLCAACGGADPPTIEEACEAQVKAQCRYSTQCAGRRFGAWAGLGGLGGLSSLLSLSGFALPSYSDFETCVAYTSPSCNGESAWGVVRSIEDIEACARWWAAQTCDALPYPGSSPCQNAKGTFPDGAPCCLPSQCVSGYCTSVMGKGTCQPTPAEGTPCDLGLWTCGTTLRCEGVATSEAKQGTCTHLRDRGEACVYGSCAPDLECDASATCRDIVRVGGACDAAHLCWASECVDGRCQAPGGLAPGAPCESSPDCDQSLGLACSALTGTCEVRYGQASVGGPCGQVPSPHGTQIMVCPTEASCTKAVNGDFRCIVKPREGEPCDAAEGPPCAVGTCQDGKCVRRVLDPANCASFHGDTKPAPAMPASTPSRSPPEWR